MMPIVGVDFDHTLVNHDKPLPGAKEAMQALRDRGYYVLIHSCNNKRWIERVLNTHNIPYDYVWDSEVDKGKPVCDWYIDDRAIGFRGDWKAVLEEISGNDAKTEAGEK